jgi:hypothetical protein
MGKPARLFLKSWSAAAFAALAFAASGHAHRASPRTAAAPAALTPARLLGRWGDNGDCAKYVIFRGDGTYRSYNGGEGSWRLAGDRLTMTGGHGTFVLTARLIEGNRLLIANPGVSVGISQRC